MKLLAALVLAASALSQASLAAEGRPGSALVGTWAVDTARLPMPPAARPKSVTIAFSAEGSDRLRTKVVVVDPTGAKLEAEGVTPLDGTPTPVTSNFEADVSATTMPRPEVLIMQLAKNGIPASTRIYAVGPDGNSMIETVAHFDGNGRPVLRRNYFARIPPNGPAAGGGAANKPDDAAVLREQAYRWDRAIVAKNRAAIEANLAEDFRQIDGAGDLEDRKSFVEGLLDPKLTIDPYTVEDFDVRLHGDVALLSGRTRMTGTYDGKPFTSHYRYIDVYVRRGGSWKVVSVQITKLPK